MATAEGSVGILARLSDELAEAVERASSAVVTVNGRRRLPASGIVWPGDRIVVTADHVLEREDDLVVTLADGQEAPATLAGRDSGSDVAVLRLSKGSPTPAQLAAPGSTKVGHLALALGRPGPGPVMASFGVVSALGGQWRTARGGVVDGYVRADVALYPGFSGGPLINPQGLVVGLNSSHLGRGQELAIPSQAVDAIVQALLKHGRVRQAYLGVSSQPVHLPAALRQKLGLGQETGLMVAWIEADSPADKGGLLIGDILVAMANQPIGRMQELQAALGPGAVGKPIEATLIRGGERHALKVTPGERK